MSEIIGHHRQREELLRDLEVGNVSHAYLFSGPAHLGKMTVAHWFADELLTSGLDAAHQEDARRQLQRLTHADLLVLDQLWIEDTCEDWAVIAESSNVPQEHRSKKSSSAKTDTISIDDIRALQEHLYGKGLGIYRCCIIGSIERMKDEAANALLKILEEPPERLVFLLTTQAESMILPTIISRARLLRFHPVGGKHLLPLLEDMGDDDRRFIVQLAQGAPGIALRLRDDPDALRLERQIHGQAHTFWETEALHQRLQLLTLLQKRGDDADRFLLHLGLALREQKSAVQQQGMKPYLDLLQDLQTNVHRQLAVQRFALCATPMVSVTL